MPRGVFVHSAVYSPHYDNCPDDDFDDADYRSIATDDSRSHDTVDQHCIDDVIVWDDDDCHDNHCCANIVGERCQLADVANDRLSAATHG